MLKAMSHPMFEQKPITRPPRVPTSIRTVPTADQLSRPMTPAPEPAHRARVRPTLLLIAILAFVGLFGGTAVVAKTVADTTASEYVQASSISRDGTDNLNRLLDQLAEDTGAPAGKLSESSLAAHKQYVNSREALAGLPALDDDAAKETFDMFIKKTTAFEQGLKSGLGGNQMEFQLKLSQQHPGNELAALEAYLESKAN